MAQRNLKINSPIGDSYINEVQAMQEVTAPVLDICWICQERLSQRTKNKTTNLCYHCYSDMLNKIVRQKKRAKDKGAEATLTIAQWAQKLRISQGRCHYCNTYIGYRALTLEHLIPVSNGGGTTADNCVPACMGCNWNSWIGRVRT